MQFYKAKAVFQRAHVRLAALRMGAPERAWALSGHDIRRLIAHRKPFLFLDYATENVIGEHVVAVQNVKSPPSRLHVLEGLGQASALVIRQVRCAMLKRKEARGSAN